MINDLIILIWMPTMFALLTAFVWGVVSYYYFNTNTFVTGVCTILTVFTLVVVFKLLTSPLTRNTTELPRAHVPSIVVEMPTELKTLKPDAVVPPKLESPLVDKALEQYK